VRQDNRPHELMAGNDLERLRSPAKRLPQIEGATSAHAMLSANLRRAISYSRKLSGLRAGLGGVF
jgi:hypothetical protein